MYLLISLFLMNISLSANEEDSFQWPKELAIQNATVTLYQPQYDSFKDNILAGRMALSVKQKKEDPVFGAMFFKARLATDLETRTAVLEKLDIERLLFPGVEDSARIERLSKLLIEEIESWDVVMSLDRIASSLSEVEDLKELSVQLNNAPPDIYFRSDPAVLVSIDGDPIEKEVEGAGFEYVVNTPFFIVKKGSTYYIKGGKFWYSSNMVSSGYTEAKKVPSDIEKFAADNLPESELDSISQTITEAPALIVTTKPSELVMTDGEPDYSTIEGTTLLYVSNTTSDIIMDINTQQHYVLLGGRWFASKSLSDGDWQFVEPEKLPEDFSKIPEGSDMGNVRVSVPGTPEAQDALLEQSIPQTAEVDRKTTVEVQWDGDPKFEKIEDTDVSVAKNADKTVLLIGGKYYCVDDAIWFFADQPQGPWAVSDARPAEVDQIPPESEAYNVKYVYIYESTPEVVYVGYLPGYTWSYVYGGCVVYGTGYWYRPWYGYYYYPRPVTWGFGVHWNPWTGWGFSFGFSYGWIGWRFHPYAGWWGPRGYYPGYRHGYHRGYHHGYRHGYRQGAARGYAAGYRASNNNVYRNRASGVRTTSPGTLPANRNLNNKARPSTKPNNMYTDRKGNVYERKKNGSWENRNNQPSTRQRDVQSRDRSNRQPTTQPQTRERTKQTSTQKQTRQRQSSSGMSTQQRKNLNQSYQNRSRGTQNYNRSQSYNRGGSMNRAGGSRGGGRRR
jgi:hypothetical protein